MKSCEKIVYITFHLLPARKSKPFCRNLAKRWAYIIGQQHFVVCR